MADNVAAQTDDTPDWAKDEAAPAPGAEPVAPPAPPVAPGPDAPPPAPVAAPGQEQGFLDKVGSAFADMAQGIVAGRQEQAKALQTIPGTLMAWREQRFAHLADLRAKDAQDGGHRYMEEIGQGLIGGQAELFTSGIQGAIKLATVRGGADAVAATVMQQSHALQAITDVHPTISAPVAALLNATTPEEIAAAKLAVAKLGLGSTGEAIVSSTEALKALAAGDHEAAALHAETAAGHVGATGPAKNVTGGTGNPDPTFMVPAIHDGATGAVHYGGRGEMHNDVADRMDPTGTASPDATDKWVPGFANPDGKFMTRDEALASLPADSNAKKATEWSGGELHSTAINIDPVETPARPAAGGAPAQTDPYGDILAKANAPRQAPNVPVMDADAVERYRLSVTKSLQSSKNGDTFMSEAGQQAPLNYDHVSNGDQVRAAVDTMYIARFDAITAARGGNEVGVMTHAETNAMATAFGADPGLMLHNMSLLYPHLQNLPALQGALKDYTFGLAQRAVDISNNMAFNTYDATTMFASRAEAHAALVNVVKQQDQFLQMFTTTQAATARATSFMATDTRNAVGLLDNPTDRALLSSGNIEEFAARLRAIGTNPDPLMVVRGTNNLTRAMRNQGGIVQGITGTFINSLLSVNTSVVKLAADIFHGGIIQPAVTALTGMYHLDMPQVISAGQQYIGAMRGFVDSVKAAGSALKTGVQRLDPSLHPTLPFHMGDGKIFSNLQNGNVGTAAVNALATTVNLPVRLMTGVDELSKQLVYRGRIQAESFREGVGMGLKGQPLRDYMSQRLENGVDSTGRATDQDALAYAHEATFSTPLSEHSGGMFGQDWATLGQATQRAVNSVPPLRMIATFIKVPTNLQRFVWAYTPGINMAQRDFRTAMLAGGEQSAQAMAKITTGTALWGSALGLAIGGHITGTGPSDVNARKQLEDTGWRPLSYVVNHPDGTKSYISFSRADPAAEILSIAADMHSLFSAGGQDPETLAVGATMAVAKSLNSKNYMTGLTNVMNAYTGAGSANSNESRMTHFWSALAGGFVPGTLGMFNPDPYMRELRSVVDGMMKRTPGLSTHLDPQRTVLGERRPVDTHYGPVDTGFDKNDPVDHEIARQAGLAKTGFQPPNKIAEDYGSTKPSGVDLTQVPAPQSISSHDDGHVHTAYDRFQELTGTLKAPEGSTTGDVNYSGMTLRQAIGAMIKSDRYKNVYTDSTTDDRGSRKGAIDSVIGAYRGLAKTKLYDEDSSLRALVVQGMARQADAQMQGGVGAKAAVPGILQSLKP